MLQLSPSNQTKTHETIFTHFFYQACERINSGVRAVFGGCYCLIHGAFCMSKEFKLRDLIFVDLGKQSMDGSDIQFFSKRDCESVFFDIRNAALGRVN